MIRLDPAVYLFAALLLLTLPLNWLVAAVCAAVFHELCHLMVLFFQGNRIRQLTIGMGGAKICTDFLDRKQELLSALAGPVGSLSLLAMYRMFPRLALCGCVQGLFNLLPIYPLDGGRILVCCLEIWLPKHRESIEKGVRNLTFILLITLTVAGSLAFSLGIFPIAVSILLIFRGFQRKIPCKRRQIGVQ